MLLARGLVRAGSRLSATLRVVGLVVLVAALEGGPLPGIVRRAASIPETAQGLEGFVNAANALITPALVAMAAVAPLGCIVGAGAMMFGSRRGMVIIGASLGTLIFLGVGQGHRRLTVDRWPRVHRGRGRAAGARRRACSSRRVARVARRRRARARRGVRCCRWRRRSRRGPIDPDPVHALGDVLGAGADAVTGRDRRRWRSTGSGRSSRRCSRGRRR